MTLPTDPKGNDMSKLTKFCACFWMGNAGFRAHHRGGSDPVADLVLVGLRGGMARHVAASVACAMTTPFTPRDSVVKVRPTEEVARAIYARIPTWGLVRQPLTTMEPSYATVRVDDTWEQAEDRHDECRAHATAVLTRLRELGAFNIEFLEAIKRESRE
jgi:hypothetical protein